LKRTETIERDEVSGFGLNDFQNSNGAAWVHLTMVPADLEIRATREGKTCVGTVSLASSGDL
jgi:hypothetical protein